MFNVETSSLSDNTFSSRISWMFDDFLHRPESLMTILHHLLPSFFDRFMVFSAQKFFFLLLISALTLFQRVFHSCVLPEEMAFWRFFTRPLMHSVIHGLSVS